MTSLFESDSLPRSVERLEEGAVLLRGFAASEAPALLEEVARIAQAAPFRHLVTPGGYTMSVAMTNRDAAGAKLSLHRDRDEKDAWAPIVSVSLGLPIVFLWGGKRRSDPVRR